MIFLWRLSDSKSPQVSRTLLSILAVFNYAVVWMVSTRLPNSKSSSPFDNPLVTVPKVPITIGIFVTFTFHSFFNSLARSRYLSLFSHYYYYYYLLIESLMVFYWSLSENKSPQVSRTLLSILAILNNDVVCMISTRPQTSKSSTPLNNPLITVSKVPITVGIIVTFMFHSFFNPLARSRFVSFFSHSFSFIL